MMTVTSCLLYVVISKTTPLRTLRECLRAYNFFFSRTIVFRGRQGYINYTKKVASDITSKLTKDENDVRRH